MEEHNRWAGATEDSVYRVASQQGVFQPVATLRDQFAMAALNALGAAFSREWSNPNDYQINVMAKGAYIVADALLAAREAK